MVATQMDSNPNFTLRPARSAAPPIRKARKARADWLRAAPLKARTEASRWRLRSNLSAMSPAEKVAENSILMREALL